MNLVPGSIVPILPIVIVHRRPGRKIVRQHSPGASCAHQIKDAVNHLAQISAAGPPTSFGRWQQWFNQFPLFICQIAWVVFIVHTSVIGQNTTFHTLSKALLNQPHMRLGYTTRMSDVEHTAEDSADVITPMMHLDPNNDLWRKRALRLAELMEVLWTSRNERGFLQFQSTYFTANKVDTNPMRACDTVYHPRAVWHLTGGTPGITVNTHYTFTQAQ